MKATELLKKQHREVESLFAKVLKTDDAKDRKKLATEITTKLEDHTTIEEEIFYPAYREASNTQKGEDLVLEAYEEHHVEEEEEEMFPDAEKKLGKERLEVLGEEMDKRAAQLAH